MNENEQKIIASVVHEVKEKLKDQESGHDWFHVLRVWNNARLMAKGEEVDLFVVELAAILHDIADWKFYDGDESVGPKAARLIMESHHVDSSVIEHVCEVIATMSYKGAGVPTSMRTKEGEVVQDADRLDALGAIGIARAFSYGGHKNRVMYDPAHLPVLHQDKYAYISNKGSTINHFYEKLLLLKDRMNTQTGKQVAEERHLFMQKYLEQFYQEWNGTQ